MRALIICFSLLLLPAFVLADTGERELAIVKQQSAAYNALNVEEYAAYFDDQIEVYNYPESPITSGKEALIEATRTAFKTHKPGTVILKTMVINDKVITLERASYSVGDSRHSANIVKIYQFQDGLIRRMTFMN